ncbi:MAG: hypothetical protein GKR90_18395 [Pseudomonadales bacterium]|nr:hypothetical protein [Pseudomonadales bacterium]
MKQTAPLEIGIPVMDLVQMVDFYVAVFGCDEIRRADIPATLSEPIRVSRDGYVNVWLQFPGGEIVKLVSPPTAPKQQHRPEFAAETTGIAYFTVYCDDIAGAMEVAEANGATLLSERALAVNDSGVKLAFLADPEGNVFEFVEA